MRPAPSARPLAAIALLLVAAGCNAGEETQAGTTEATPVAGPVAVIPDAPDPTPFTRAYSLTESADGRFRVFAQEKSDDTDLFLMRQLSDEEGWTGPELIDLPHRASLTSPHFAPDGLLYYASDMDVATRTGRTDLNIFKVRIDEDGRFGTPVMLSDDINTGAHEISPAMAADGTFYFTSNHSRSGGGGFDITMARPTGAPMTPADALIDVDGEAGNVLQEPAGSWTVEPVTVLNEFRADDHLALTADGNRIFFYSHRSPKFGNVDIWTATRDESGVWSEPRNLGPAVNTDAIEFGAGLSGDGKTFFFSRDGRLLSLPLERALSTEGQGPEPEQG